MKKSPGTAILIVGVILVLAALWTARPFAQPASAQRQSSTAPRIPARYRVIDAKSETDLEKQLNDSAAQGWQAVGLTFDSSRNLFIAVIGQ